MAILFAVLAGICWGVGEVFTKQVLHSGKVGPLAAIAVRSTVALPLLWGVYAVVAHGIKQDTTQWGDMSSGTWWRLILGSGVLAGFGGMACFYLALNFGEVSRVKPIAFALAPAIGATLGWLMLGESMTPKKVGGIALIVAGVVALATK